MVLAWSDCIAASWLLAAGHATAAQEALAMAYDFVDRSARSRDTAFGWRRIVAPNHGLTVAPPRRG